MSVAADLSFSNNPTCKDLFIQGKRCYIVGHYSKAIEHLSQVCKIKESENDPLCDDLFSTYYYLAKAYYMYGKSETELIGEGLPLTKEENEEEEANGEEDSKNAEEIGVQEEQTKTTDTKESEPESTTEDIVENTTEPVTGSAAEDHLAKDQLTYMQLAYETMECAKVILNRQIKEGRDNLTELKMCLADCHDLVGNVYVEESVIDQALVEYQAALDLRIAHLDSNDRAIAESHYNMAVAYSVDLNSSKAIDSYNRCREIMVACRDALSADDKERLGLEEIINDIDDRILDCSEGERHYQLAKESIKEFMSNVTSNQPITDITHLLKRKSSNPDESSFEEPSAKKQK